MAMYVLIHGASSDAWYWHRVIPLLLERGHEVAAPDLPIDDDAARLAEYADVVVAAVGRRHDLILVAHSMAGFTAPIVSTRLPVDLLVMVAAMVPRPNESPGEWWENTGYMHARRGSDARLELPIDGTFDPLTIFFHDVPDEVAAELSGEASGASLTHPSSTPGHWRTGPTCPLSLYCARRTVLSGRVHAARGPGPARDHTGRNGKRAPARARAPC